ncbi:penicillin-binding protein 1C [Sphingomonas montana]|uniref:penicillin-binding protein 1C n=1 Tax=Sphingomonas montana TaxID=1843236 RepID=UPI00096FA139|nr:penicillin-binding protein 1C [Sphingomonas montana]
MLPPIALLLVLIGFGWWTSPPTMPTYAETRAGWRPSEAWLRDRHGRLLETVRVDFAVRRLDWVPLGAVAPVLQGAVMAAEDRRFARHGGVDWIGLAGSALGAIRGRPPRGASTLTMQLAGFLAPELGEAGRRSFVGKLRQMRAAWALERGWSKDAILEAYLNLATFRGETQGVGAAARALFGRAPDALDRNDALLLAALLPAPQARPDAVGRRACRMAGAADCTLLIAAAETMTGADRQLADSPRLAPHLAARLLERPGQTVTTTIDAGVQAFATATLARQLMGLGADHARDGAVVVVDNASGDVLAYVGGAGDGSTAPQVDNANSLRQAGSTLKPFLYAQAIERRFLTAASLLDDSPLQLDTATGLYVPKDYDHRFKGPVSVRSALAGSLNVPAVRTLLLDGVEEFRDRLWDVGYHGLTEAGDYYGFSLALGSAEVTLMQQAAAYRALADAGRYRPLRMRMDAAGGGGNAGVRAVMDARATWIVNDIMADTDARAGTFGTDSALRLPFWAAAKTGTSKAMRDNWCIGFSDRYTVAVWIGNAEGDSMVHVSGTSGAAPVWRDLMMALHRGSAGRAPAVPPGIERHIVRYADDIEPPRVEAFMAGTGQARLIAAPATARRPHIVTPVAGAVYAFDPDIPIARQRIRIATVGAVAGDRLLLDGRMIGAAGTAHMILAGPGRHRIDLIDRSGTATDHVLFAVR